MAIAKNRNTFEKRKREMDKKAKADAKRTRRMNKKKRDEQASETDNPGAQEDRQTREE